MMQVEGEAHPLPGVTRATPRGRPSWIDGTVTHGREDRHHAATHNPLTSPSMVGLARYREVRGDVITRLVVARYRGILDGYPLWHVSVQFTDASGALMLRSRWGRREVRLARRTADGLLANHGEGELVDGDPLPGLSTELALHRLKRMRRAEMGHLPAGWLDQPSIELTAAAELSIEGFDAGSIKDPLVRRLAEALTEVKKQREEEEPDGGPTGPVPV